ncbi:MAG: TolC family protein, partial [Cyclobacteriaceae bacterium]|nr:TolC family protein [Cyclobacteriaceae bacterium]
QIEISGTGIQLSKNLVEASMGQQGEYTITGSAALKQVIYSEPAFASIAIKKLSAENTKQFNKQTMLDIVLNVSRAYVSLLFAKNNLQIQNDNVYVTFQNLEMAKAKEESGEGSISDVNRWTSELSLNKMDLNDAQAGYKAAMYHLNEFLNLPISQTITTTDSAGIDEIIVLNQQILSLYFDNPNLTEKYANFLVDEMRINSPELQQLLNAEKIIDRKKSMHSRQMYIPEVALFGSADQAFVREGIIENIKLPVPPPPDDITWNFGVRFSLPLYEGGRKKSELNRSLIELDKINWQKKDLLNNLERSIRSNVQLLKASYRELDLSQKAAQAAEDNFKLIQDAYAQGVANVVQLIDAQNVMIRTKHLAISAYYQYILDFILTERMQGKFSFLDNEMEQEMYTDRLLNYLTEEE